MLSTLLLCSSLFVAAPDADRAAYEAARAKVGRDAEAHVKLALWCEAHGLNAERTKHLALAVLSDPQNAVARGLLGMVAFHGQWKRPEAVSEKVGADDALMATMKEYQARRARTPETADAQWKLGLWCEQNGLKAEATAHFSVVARLDPSREAAWKRLGCKKHNGRWLTEKQIAAGKEESELQKKADKHWKPLLTKWRDALASKDKTKREEAKKALEEVTDPRAVPSIWAVFLGEDEGRQDLALQLLGQIDSAGASRALAALAVFGKSPESRRVATETLKNCDPREFAGLLVALLRQPIKYEVRPVGGPGTPGALFVAGKQFDVQRLYAPPGTPPIALAPNDVVWFDQWGMPVIARFNDAAGEMLTTHNQALGPTTRLREFRQSIHGPSVRFADVTNFTVPQFADFQPTDPLLAQAVNNFRAVEASEVNRVMHYGWLNNRFSNGDYYVAHHNPAFERNFLLRVDVTRIDTDLVRSTTQTQTDIPIGQIMAEYQKAAVSAQMQLLRDRALLDAFNEGVENLNARALPVLKAIAGKDLGEDLVQWRAWWINAQGLAYIPQKERPRPTIVENVPLDYTPRTLPPTTFSSSQSESTPLSPTFNVALGSMAVSSHSCFGAGTLVRTLRGPERIETLHVGDQVLSQDIRTGGLGYKPILVVHHNPPSPTFLIKVAGDTIVSSPFHRFWVAGKGWVLARELKGGEILRTLDGPARAESVESGPVQPVFNLDVAENYDFFAGAAGALVHDCTLPDLRLVPFDAAPDLATIAKASR